MNRVPTGYEGAKMQYQDEEETKNIFSTEKRIQQQPELRNPWRKLLGAQYPQPQGQPIVQAHDHEESPLLANDPWNDLLQAQGIEVVDLQQVRLHAVQVSMDNLDVEQALDIMQEQPVDGTSEP